MTRDRPVFSCPAGTFLGRHDAAAGVDRATGIRYARADRFALPRPVPPHTSPVEATTWSPACPQPLDVLPAEMVHEPMGELTYAEDCQALSVTVPAGTRADAGLPVMVWVHGGAHLTGAGDAPLYDPSTLVREQQVVVVNVTYRLGVLGFLGGGDRPANLGLHDLLLALRWVRDNIAGFGGDPAQVSAFGESAGADAIAHLMIAEGGRGLFARAVLMSAPLGLRHGRDAVVDSLARRAERADLTAGVQQVADGYRSLARGALRHGLPAVMPFGIQYGHPPLPAEEDADEVWRAVAPEIDLLVGWNVREAALFLPHLGPARLAARLPLAGPRVAERLVDRLTRRIYADGSRELVDRHREAGGRALCYQLRTGRQGERYASAHATDIPLLFPTRQVWEDSPMLAGWSWPEVLTNGAVLREQWGRFARTGQVDGDALPRVLSVDG